MGWKAQLLAIAMFVPGVLSAQEPDAGPSTGGATWGLVKEQPIEVCEPQGQRQYLARLICPGHEHPVFERLGNVGPRTPLPAVDNEAQERKLVAAIRSKEKLENGAPDYHWIDAYEVDCSGTRTTLYLDMYHCAVPPPSTAPAGFTFQR